MIDTEQRAPHRRGDDKERWRVEGDDRALDVEVRGAHARRAALRRVVEQLQVLGSAVEAMTRTWEVDTARTMTAMIVLLEALESEERGCSSGDDVVGVGG